MVVAHRGLEKLNARTNDSFMNLQSVILAKMVPPVARMETFLLGGIHGRDHLVAKCLWLGKGLRLSFNKDFKSVKPVVAKTVCGLLQITHL